MGIINKLKLSKTTQTIWLNSVPLGSFLLLLRQQLVQELLLQLNMHITTMVMMVVMTQMTIHQRTRPTPLSISKLENSVLNTRNSRAAAMNADPTRWLPPNIIDLIYKAYD